MSNKKKMTKKELAEVATVELHAKAADTARWLFAAAAAKGNWPIGLEMSRGDYDAAISAASNERIE